MNPSSLEIVAASLFGMAILHTFLVHKFAKASARCEAGSFAQKIFHLLSEVELVFGLWAVILAVSMWLMLGFDRVLIYQKNLSFIEPLFVFCILIVASTRPIFESAKRAIHVASLCCQKVFRTSERASDLFMILCLGPLLGSLITEPAAMTLTALLLVSVFRATSARLAYFLMAVLFVNVSVGGSLTPFAAPPLLMVVRRWGWDFSYVFQNFGLKSLLIVVTNALLINGFFKKEIAACCGGLREMRTAISGPVLPIPIWVTCVHLVLLALTVLFAHDANVFLVIFALFLAVYFFTQQWQYRLRWKEGVLVALFLAGLVEFGSLQAWWLTPTLSSLSDQALFAVATALTAITDNAALTFLGSQVQSLGNIAKYALVAGALAGGGLTVIANAPNPAGLVILKSLFPDESVSPWKLFVAALIPTLVAALVFSGGLI